MIVDGNEKVVALNWTYSNVDGALSNQLKLAVPYGDISLAAVTEEVAIGWLEEQLKNTREDFDAAIAKHKEERDYAETLVAYNNDGAGAFQLTPTEEVVETPA